MRVDFAGVKSVPIGAVLKQRGIEMRRQGDFLIAVNCPLPSHASKETRTFKVNISENWWTCFVDT